MFNKLVCFALILIPFFTLMAEKYQSAHAIVISQYNHHDYVLLGKMKGTQVLSSFGGLRDPGEKDPKSTCAREVEEEALGVLGNQRQVYALLKNAPQISGFHNGHICYVLPATFFGNNIPFKFRKKRFNTHKLTHGQKEMIDIVSIRLDKLKATFLKGEPITFPDNQGIQRSLRSSTQGAIKAALDSGRI